MINKLLHREIKCSRWHIFQHDGLVFSQTGFFESAKQHCLEDVAGRAQNQLVAFEQLGRNCREYRSKLFKSGIIHYLINRVLGPDIQRAIIHPAGQVEMKKVLVFVSSGFPIRETHFDSLRACKFKRPSFHL